MVSSRHLGTAAASLQAALGYSRHRARRNVMTTTRVFGNRARPALRGWPQRVALAVSLTAASCVSQPVNNQSHCDGAHVTFEGSTLLGNRPVRIEAYNWLAGQFETVGRTRSPASTHDVGGCSVSDWSTTVTLSNPKRFWMGSHGGSFRSRFRVLQEDTYTSDVPMTTLDADGAECWQDMINAGKNCVEAWTECQSTASPVITLVCPRTPIYP